MKNIMSQTLRVLALGMVSASLLLTSCNKDDNNPTFADPTIGVTAASSQQIPGGTVTFTIAVAAEAGIKSVMQGTTEIKTYSTDTKADVFTYDYTVPATQALGTLAVPFTVTDMQGEAKSANTSASITVTQKPKPVVTVDQALSASTTWTSDNFYLLKGNIYVQSGVELTIQPGTIILGDKVTKGSLIVSRGGKIHAVGTETNPIIFTSNAPVNFRNYGDWGGVVLLGKAPNNQSASQTIEGISAATGDNGLYGGTTEEDNSGEFQYCRIEFAGIALSTDNELNGLTFGSVGSGTKVDHVQVSYSGDDSYEWFGGSVKVDHLIAYRGWDDEFDTDFGFHGQGQFLVSYRDPNIADKSGSNGFESDNNAQGDGKTPLTTAMFSNVSFFGPYSFANLSGGALSASAISSNYKRGGHIRRNSALQVYNCVFVGANVDGIFFENTNAAAVFKGNYIARITGKVFPTIPAGTLYDTTALRTDNPTIETAPKKVDISDKFAAFSASALVANLANPNPLLSASSPLLTAAKTVPSNLVQTQFIGAFDATTNWSSSTWTNYNPNGTNYGF